MVGKDGEVMSYVCETKNGYLFRYLTEDKPDEAFGIRMFIIEGGVYLVAYGPSTENDCLEYIRDVENSQRVGHDGHE